MKTNNLKILTACLAILISFIFLGCAQQSMNRVMDKNMETTMEEPMDTKQDEAMKNDMDGTKDKMMK